MAKATPAVLVFHTCYGIARIASGDRNGTLRIWDPATSSRIAEIRNIEGIFSISPVVLVDENVLLAVSGLHQATLRLVDPISGKVQRVLNAGPGEEFEISIVTVQQADGSTLLASENAGGNIHLWNPDFRYSSF